MEKSQAMARLRPPPAQEPSSQAMTGFFVSRIESTSRFKFHMFWRVSVWGSRPSR